MKYVILLLIVAAAALWLWRTSIRPKEAVPPVSPQQDSTPLPPASETVAPEEPAQTVAEQAPEPEPEPEPETEPETEAEVESPATPTAPPGLPTRVRGAQEMPGSAPLGGEGGGSWFKRDDN